MERRSDSFVVAESEATVIERLIDAIAEIRRALSVLLSTRSPSLALSLFRRYEKQTKLSPSALSFLCFWLDFSFCHFHVKCKICSDNFCVVSRE